MPTDAELELVAEQLSEGITETESLSQTEESAPVSPPATEEAPETAEPAEEQADTGLTAEFYAQKLPESEMTYGDFKDRAKELAQVDEIRTSLETERSEFRNERLQMARQVQMLKQAGKLSFSEDEQKFVNDFEQAGLQMEAQLILTAIPEWKSDTTVTADVEEISRHWAPYGVTGEEIQQLLRSDARFAKEQYDNLLQRRRLAAAEAKVKAARKPKAQAPTRGGHRSQKQDLLQLADNPDASAEDRQLAALLGGLSE